MIAQEIDRIQNAIRHIQTSADIDPWAAEMAISALQEQELKQELKQEVKNSKESISTHKALDIISRKEW